MGISYIGKCLLIEENKIKALVVGDLHLAHVGGMGVGGVKLVDEVWSGMIKEFDDVFNDERIGGKVDYIVLLGDLRSGFGRLQDDERNEIGRLIDYLGGKCDEVIVIKGNHDNYVVSVLASRGIENRETWKWNGYLFVHGDKGIESGKMEDVECIVMGHMHPAIVLEEGAKREKYKCFLVGNVRGKKVIILPSFIDVNEGIDVLGLIDEENVWGWDLRKFEVMVVGEGLEVMSFGKLGKLTSAFA